MERISSRALHGCSDPCPVRGEMFNLGSVPHSAGYGSGTGSRIDGRLRVGPGTETAVFLQDGRWPVESSVFVLNYMCTVKRDIRLKLKQNSR